MVTNIFCRKWTNWHNEKLKKVICDLILSGCMCSVHLLDSQNSCLKKKETECTQCKKLESGCIRGLVEERGWAIEKSNNIKKGLRGLRLLKGRGLIYLPQENFDIRKYSFPINLLSEKIFEENNWNFRFHSKICRNRPQLTNYLYRSILCFDFMEQSINKKHSKFLLFFHSG